jgi:hypothetical protein
MPRLVLIASMVLMALGSAAFSEFPTTQPTPLPVTRFVFAPNGDETWCLMGDPDHFSGETRPRAMIYRAKDNSWKSMPEQHEREGLHAVLFAKGKKTSWAVTDRDGEPDPISVLHERQGSGAWKPVLQLPPAVDVTEMWLSPAEDEIWINAEGNGLIRYRCATGQASQYVKSSFRTALKEHYALGEDYAGAVAFTSDNRTVVCSSMGGNDYSITLIDLQSGKSDIHAIDWPVDQIVLSPDNKTAWCARNTMLWAFDLETKKWTHKFTGFKKSGTSDALPLIFIDWLIVSPDGKFVWIRGNGGVAVLSLSDKMWTCFLTDEWKGSSPLQLTSDGKHVLCGQANGVAIFSVDGVKMTLLKPPEEMANCKVTHLEPIPESRDFICSIAHPTLGGIYRVNLSDMRLEQVTLLTGKVVTAIAVQGDVVWIGCEDRVFTTALTPNRSKP